MKKLTARLATAKRTVFARELNKVLDVLLRSDIIPSRLHIAPQHAALINDLAGDMPVSGQLTFKGHMVVFKGHMIVLVINRGITDFAFEFNLRGEGNILMQ